MTEKTPNYSDAQVALIVAAIRENGNVANGEVAETLAANPAMNTADGPRKSRSIIAKMRRVVDATEGFTYERKAPVTKDGKPVQKKLDMVERIATLAGVPVAKLDGLANAPKLALDTLLASYSKAA